jgi:hypothetical protein
MDGTIRSPCLAPSMVTLWYASQRGHSHVANALFFVDSVGSLLSVVQMVAVFGPDLQEGDINTEGFRHGRDKNHC